MITAIAASDTITLLVLGITQSSAVILAFAAIYCRNLLDRSQQAVAVVTTVPAVVMTKFVAVLIVVQVNYRWYGSLEERIVAEQNERYSRRHY